jgi:hypothetical protein
MAEALKIDTESGTIYRTSGFVGWPEELVLLGKSYPNVVSTIEKKLAELVKDTSVQYYYFPEQKIAKVNGLIAEIASNYGFLTELVDVRYKKANVIVRRQNSHIPTIPSKLLSEVCSTYNPTESHPNPYIIKPEEFNSQKKIPNGLYFTGIRREVDIKMIWEKIQFHFLATAENVMWFWMDDDQGFLYFRAKEAHKDIETANSTENESQLIEDDIVLVPESDLIDDAVELVDRDTLESQEMPIVLTLAEQCQIAVADLVQEIADVTISPVGGIHFDGGRISHYKRRNKESFRFNSIEHGWQKTTSSWKEEGILLQKDKGF